MRIKRVECEQFAGVLGKELVFDQGLNLVIGDNESGKSTMVDLIYYLLFQDVKLDGRSDSEFIDRYFPKKISGPQGDVIDGILVFETPDGTYKLKKEWEKGEGVCRLILPDGTSMKGNAAINKILAEELKHRAGVYSEIVFASQKRNQIAVESIMKALSKKADPFVEARADLTSVLTQVALETGGVSLEKIERALQENRNQLIGRWDQSMDAPEGGPKRASYRNAWDKGAGQIVKAYYEMDRVRDLQARTEETERAVETAKGNLQKLQKKKKEIEGKREEFQKFRGMLGQRSLLSKAVRSQEESIAEWESVLEKWPGLRTAVLRAKELQTKQRQAAVHALYVKAQNARQEFENMKSELENIREVNPADIKTLRELLSRKQMQVGKLTGMNLVAKIKRLGKSPVEVRSAASGNALEAVDEELRISEAVDITVPGVLEMQLMPQGIDVESVKASIGQTDTEIRAMYEKYGISDVEALQSLADIFLATKQEAARRRMLLEQILGDSSWEDVKAANDEVPAGIETEEEIRRQILDLCGMKSVDAYIGGLEAMLGDYERKYESMEKLHAALDTIRKEKAANQLRLEMMEEIPDAFRGIDDPDRYDAGLQAELDQYDMQIREYDTKLRAIERNLGEKSAEEYSEELQEKKAAWEAKKVEYEHWTNIYRVFCRLKGQTVGNPVADIAEKFKEYLAAMTEGSLALRAMDEQMAVQIASGTHALTYDILSDGTKDTISLAFRLAMLEHLYPDGDGLAVFDDPFTDMDPKRVGQACRLIQKFARNNQVIFITCDEKYKKLMAGNVISVI